MADVTGILLDGWFLERPELQEELPRDVLSTIDKWRNTELDQDARNDPSKLPRELYEVYKEVCANSRIRKWCWTESPLGQSLKKRPVTRLDIFPFGSLDSLLAAVVLAERIREENKNASVDGPLVTNKSCELSDEFVTACARRTWEWVKLQVGRRIETVALNLTSCRPETRRAYRWIFALAKNLLTTNQPKEITGFAFLELEEDIYPVFPTDQVNIYGLTEFLKYYFHNIPPDDKLMERFYRDLKIKLDHDSSDPANNRLLLILDAWLKWSENTEDKRDEEPPAEAQMMEIGPTGAPRMEKGPFEPLASMIGVPPSEV